MNREDIIRMAEQAGAAHLANVPGFTDFLTRFAGLVAEAEREACAKVCREDPSTSYEWWDDQRPGLHYAEIIRARGKHDHP
jgi:hypothetical protein